MKKFGKSLDYINIFLTFAMCLKDKHFNRSVTKPSTTRLSQFK